MTIGRYRLQKTLTQYKDATTIPVEFIGELGVAIGGSRHVEVPSRDGYVYVRLRNDLSELIQAYNDQVSPVYGLPVIVERDKTFTNRWRIKGRDLGRYAAWGTSSYLPRHGPQHSFDPYTPGGDPVWVWGRQMMPLAVVPSGSYGAGNVIIEESIYYQNGLWHFGGGTGTASIVALKPTNNQAKMVLVYLDGNGNPGLVDGTTLFSATYTGTSQVYPYIPNPPSGYALPLAGIRLVSGTSSILWSNIYDVRPWIVGSGIISTGTSAGHVIADEGVALTNRPTLNFIGTDVWAIDNPGTDRTDIIVSGSSAGHIIQESGVDLTARSRLNFTNGLVAYDDGASATIVSGTVQTYPIREIVFSGLNQYPTSNPRFFIYNNEVAYASGSVNVVINGKGLDSNVYNYGLNLYADSNDGVDSLGLWAYGAYFPSIEFRYGRGTEESPSQVLSGDIMFSVYGWGLRSASAWVSPMRIWGTALENMATTAQGMSLDIYLKTTGTSAYYSALSLRAREVRFGGSVAIPTGVSIDPSPAYYFGLPAASNIYPDGTWRITRSEDNLIFQRLESGSWVTKNTMTP